MELSSMLLTLKKQTELISADELKYRYIKMNNGGAGGEFIMELDELFRNKDNKSDIRNLLYKVKDYGETVRQKVITEEQTRLLEQEYNQLNNKARTVKNK